MAFGREEQQPLLVSRTTSHADRRLSEEDALLTSQRTAHTSSSPPARSWLSRWREIALFLWALLATAAVIVLAVLLQHAQQTSGDPFSPHHDRPHPPPHPPSSSSPATPPSKRNLIFMVSDGMGPSSLSLTRSFHQHVSGLAWNDTLVLDRHLIGQSRTRSSDSWVTDSAAGATAFACGFKSYNGAISVLPPIPGHEGFEEGIGAEGGGEGRGRGRGGEAEIVPCGTVMEAAKLQGYLTGLVVTTRVTDATPATFVSHVRRREMEDAIARQMVGDETNPLGRVVDLVVGGGRCRFLPNSTAEGCRGDDRDLVAWAKDEGWMYVSSREEWENLDATTGDALPLLALLAPGDIPFEIDRRQEEGEGAHPSLEETTRKALRILEAATRDRDQGFFVMIEGSRIDHAGHFNDPAAQVHEVLAYDRAVAAVLEFIEQSETPTLLVATSDHETGGLAVARQVEPEYPDYLWYPEVLANVSHSAAWAAHQYHEFIRHYPGNLTQDLMENYLYVLSYEALGIEDVRQTDLDFLIVYPGVALDIFADMISRHAQIGWSTHGHTAADVNIYTSEPHAAAALRGNHENTDVGRFLRSYLDLDKAVEKVTKKLRKHAHIDDNTASIPRDGRSPYAGGDNFALIPWKQDRNEFTWHI